MRSFRLGERQVLVCHTADGFHAVDALCTHASAELDQGRLRGFLVHCPLHSGAFDCRTGAAVRRPAEGRLATYALQVTDGWVEILLPG